MLKKITGFFGTLITAILIAGAALFLFGGIASSLEVRCQLQEDQSYTCEGRDVILGIRFSKVNAEQVNRLERDFSCGGSGTKRSCSERAYFITADGNRIRLSNIYISTDQVPEMVDTLNSLMAEKSTPIDKVFPPSTFISIITISIGSCLLILFLFISVMLLFGKNVKDIETHAIDLRQKN